MGDLQVTSFGGPALREEQPDTVGVKQRSKSTELPNNQERRNMDMDKTQLAMRITNTGSLSGLYAMILASMAIVLTLAQVLSGAKPNSTTGTVLSVFHMYVYVVAFLFLVYLEISIKKFKRQKDRSGVNTKPCVASLSPPTAVTPTGHTSEIFLIDPENKNHGTISEADIKAKLDKDNTDYDSVVAKLFRFPAFQFNGEGENLFARMGLIAFGLGAVLLDGFRLMMTAEAPNAYKCYGLVSILPITARLLFTFLQIFSLFKNHKVLINYRHMLMKFGLLHVAAANLCTWVYTLVLEAQQSFSTSSEHSTQDNNTHHNGSHFSRPSGNDKDMVKISSCYRRSTLYDVASPYLYPFVIEFSLLAAAMFYKILSNIGHTTVCHLDEEHTKETPERDEGPCDKASSGLFLGLALFVCAGIAMCLFIYLLSKGGMSDTTFMIYLISEMVTNGVQLFAIIPSFYQFSKLHFTGVLEAVFDQNILIIALGGAYTLLGFLGFAAASQVHSPGIPGTFAILQLTVSLLKFITATLQTTFIVDALRRRVKEPEQHYTKPGKSCVTFLLIANLAMWLINTFQLKEVHHAELFTKMYGKLAWTIILHIFLPLAVFFRFHASVLLSDIWEKTYDRHHIHTVHLLSLIPNMKEQ